MNNIIDDYGLFQDESNRVKDCELQDSITRLECLLREHGVIQDFPFIEAEFVAVTYYNLLCDVYQKVLDNELKPATTTTLGGIKVGNNLSITEDGTLSATGGGGGDIPIASATTLGGIKVGNNLSITEDGTLSATGGISELPIATDTTLGGIKVGINLSITEDGTLSADSQVIDSGLSSTKAWSANYAYDNNNLIWNVIGERSDLDTEDKSNLVAAINEVNSKASYELPVASTTTLGGIKVGTNLSIEEDGTLSASGGAEIDDTTTSTTTTWSSSKINTDINAVDEKVIDLEESFFTDGNDTVVHSEEGNINLEGETVYFNTLLNSLTVDNIVDSLNNKASKDVATTTTNGLLSASDKVNYDNTVSILSNNTDLTTESKSYTGAVNELNSVVNNIKVSLTNKQDKTDNSLATTNKTIVGAINEINNDLANMIKSKGFNVDTDAYGNGVIMYKSEGIPIGVNINTPSYLSYRFARSDSMYLLKCGTNSPDNKPYIGSISGTVYYITM